MTFIADLDLPPGEAQRTYEEAIRLGHEWAERRWRIKHRAPFYRVEAEALAESHKIPSRDVDVLLTAAESRWRTLSGSKGFRYGT